MLHTAYQKYLTEHLTEGRLH